MNLRSALLLIKDGLGFELSVKEKMYLWMQDLYEPVISEPKKVEYRTITVDGYDHRVLRHRPIIINGVWYPPEKPRPPTKRINDS